MEKGKNTNTIYVFIDASNLWQAQKVKGRSLDYQKVSDYIKNNKKATLLAEGCPWM